ncbi:MAG: hypothetical protein AABX33_00775 [Nanoarchaeota archaeon]
MGFLKLLKRNKKENLEDLDLPPEPPPLEGFEEDFSKLPEEDFSKLPDLPTFPEGEISGSDIPMPQFDFPERMEIIQDSAKESIAPEFTNLSGIGEMPMAPAEPVDFSTELIPELPQSTPIELKNVPEEAQLKEIPSGKTLYVRVDEFKTTLGSINIIRSDLRKAEETLMKLEGIKTAKDKSFDEVRSALDDLQKRLIFVDKTLFKGE